MSAGGDGLQRLAARLIARFAERFPDDLESSCEVLAQLVKARPADTPRSALQTATLQDALEGLGLAAAKLCQLCPGHSVLQEVFELLVRY